MTFSSITFVFLFLPVFLAFYFLVKPKHRNIALIVFSFLFYFCGEKLFTLILLFSCIFNFIFGKLIEKYNKKWILAAGIIYNLSILCIFKYFNFFIDNINVLHIFKEIKVSPVHLPIGISFFTFQAISYIVDIYKKEIKSANFKNFTLYLSLFPHIIAGPIVRYKTIFNEIKKRTVNSENFALGIKRFIRGLSKKVIIANTISYTVDSIFAHNPNELTSLICLLGAILYTLQIYFDFSGYSDMAIGLAKMLGFNFPENFNYPYISKSVRDFWRRWHISLSSWFKDYVYIPLGGNRKHVLANLIIVFFLTGLWHGASWTFIIWGLYHGFFIVLERLGLLKKIPDFLCHTYLLTVITIGWVIFRAPDISYALSYIKVMFDINHSVSVYRIDQFLNKEVLFTLVAGVIFSIPVYKKFAKYVPSFIKICIYMVLLVVSTSYLAVDTYNPFIYFRF